MDLLPAAAVLASLKRAGWRHKDIAARYGVSVRTVQNRLAAYGLARTRGRYADYLPWTVSTKHANATVAGYLRALARLDRGESLPTRKARPALAWRERMDRDGLAVTYDPTAGFTLVARDAGEGLVRPGPAAATAETKGRKRRAGRRRARAATA